MRDLFKILEACRAKKYMTRLAMFPGGHIHLGIYDSDNQSRQYMYEGTNMDEIEAQVKKDFPKLLSPQTVIPSLPKLPPIPGFPRP